MLDFKEGAASSTALCAVTKGEPLGAKNGPCREKSVLLESQELSMAVKPLEGSGGSCFFFPSMRP